MATGLRIPVGVDGTGGAALTSGDAQDRKIIMTALGDNESENAFQQDIGLGSFMIFDVDAPDVQAQVLRRIRRIFQEFRAQQRFKLLDDTVKFKKEAEGELAIEFKYRNLESDEERPFRTALIGGRFTLATE